MKKHTTRKSPSRLKKNSLANPLAKVRRAVFIVFPVAVLVVAVYFISVETRSAFSLRQMVFVGNRHFSDNELKSLAGLKEGQDLLTLSSRKIYDKLMRSVWIRSVMVRKELPHRILIVVTESEPFALLDMKGHIFIVDDRGELLERLKSNPIPFLPVIAGDPFGKKEAFLDAISLAKAIRKTGLLQEEDHVEITASKAEDLSVDLDGTLVKVGEGNYERKLRRLMDVQGAIRKRGIPVDYIDLRFGDKVVVKARHEVTK